MKTKIKGQYVVGWENGQHVIYENGEVVYEHDKIVFVGHNYPDAVARTIDAGPALISPGLINAHCVTNVDLQVLRIDVGNDGFFKPVSYLKDPKKPQVLDERDTQASVRSALLNIVKGGSTTFASVTTGATKRWHDPEYEPKLMCDAVGEVGLRGYLTHNVRALEFGWDGTKTVHLYNEEAAHEGLRQAEQLFVDCDGAHDGRVRVFFFPYTLETAGSEVLQACKALADRYGTHVRTHFAQSREEVGLVVEKYQKSPIAYLDSLGFLDRNVILTHAVYGVEGDGLTDAEMALLIEKGVSVAHCPTVFVRRGEMLRSFGRYVRGGLNMVLGTDTYPQNMIEEMRLAALFSKVADGDAESASAREVFNAATCNAARALGRDDIGRLEAGCKADIIVVDLEKGAGGCVDDPIKALVHYASTNHVDTVIVDGKTVIEHGRHVSIDEEALYAQARVAFSHLRDKVVEWGGGTLEQVLPRAFPVYPKPD